MSRDNTNRNKNQGRSRRFVIQQKSHLTVSCYSGESSHFLDIQCDLPSESLSDGFAIADISSWQMPRNFSKFGDWMKREDANWLTRCWRPIALFMNNSSVCLGNSPQSKSMIDDVDCDDRFLKLGIIQFWFDIKALGGKGHLLTSLWSTLKSSFFLYTAILVCVISQAKVMLLLEVKVNQCAEMLL